MMVTMARADVSTDPHRGRPRSAEADQAIAEATLELLAEKGWAGLTMNGVAHRAGVSTATLYRRYSSKEDLVCAAMHESNPANASVDTGSLEGDLRAKLTEMVNRMRGEDGARVKGIIGE